MKRIDDFSLKGKKVIIRCDLNVPIKNGVILDDTRIKESLKTIKYAIRKSAKIIILSHLGRIKEKEDLEKNSLEIVSSALAKSLKHKVTFIPDTKGKNVKQAIDNMKNKDIILLENTRYEDLKGRKESTNDKKIGKYWASLGDIYINDAFAVCHRAHASSVGIAENIENKGIGFLVEKELKNLKPVLTPKRPFVLIIGGAKIKDKIPILTKLLEKADYMLIGGAMAFTFLKASGFKVGHSLVEEESLDFAREMLEKYEGKIILPIDVVLESGKTVFVNEIKDDSKALDIGSQTVKVFSMYIKEAKTIFWNGPLGLFEDEKFAVGTNKICEIISKEKIPTVVGGGDTASAVIKSGFKVGYISTGGGASLEYVAYETLPALEALK